MSDTVITGVGVVAPNGADTDAYWSATLDGKSGIDRIARFDPSGYPVTLAGELTSFDPAEHVPSRLLVETSAMTHLGFAASAMALADAGLDPAQLPEYEMGVVTANAVGGVEVGQRELQNLWSNGPEHVSAYMSIAWFYAATSGQLSIRHKLRGHCGVVVSEQAGGLDALGQGRRLIRGGHRMAVVGGAESVAAPAGLAAQIPTGELSQRSDPNRAYLPFDADACGHVPGEGAGFLILEEATSARQRGVRQCYGEVAGYAATFDPRPGSGRPPGLARAARLALQDAGCEPGDVDVVFADASGVPRRDRAEADAITEVFGAYGVPVTAPKSMTGRLYAAAGAVDVVAALLSIRDGLIPAVANVGALASGVQIDLVRDRPRRVPVRTALVLARGHGGFNSAVLLRARELS